MYLYLDNSAAEAITLGYYYQGKWASRTFSPAVEGGALGAIAELIQSFNLPLSAIKGLLVRVGVGRFTATRVAITAVNTLSYVLHIPVRSVLAAPSADPALVLSVAAAGRYALPSYSGEPRIGKS